MNPRKAVWTPSMRSARAFTLIEVLVTACVVATLAALLLPALSKMRESGRAAVCANNLRSIGAAFQLYAADNEGLYPAVRFKEGKWGNQNPTKKEWPFEINPYLQAAGKTFAALSSSAGGKAVFCPEFMEEFKTSWQDAWTAGYGMNPNLGTGGNAWDDRPRAVAIPKPSSTVLVGDSDAFHLNVQSGDEWSSPDARGRYGSGDPFRHGKSANYLFADGHVSRLAMPEAQDVLMAVQP